MKRKYTLKDTNPMSWQEFGSILDSLFSSIQSDLESNQISVDAVAPVLRSGALPAAVLANKLEIIPMIPIQVKHNYQEQQLEQLLPVAKPLTPSFPSKPTILVCECNTFSGKSARAAASLLQTTFPEARLFYATVTKVYRSAEIDLSMFEKAFVGKHTNEGFEANQETATKKELRPKITIFPWETAARELRDINGEQEIL